MGTKQFTVNKIYTDNMLNDLGFWCHKARWGSTAEGIPGLNQKFKKWDQATHEACTSAAAIRAIVAADRYAGMMVALNGATPEVYVYSATDTTADDGVTYLVPTDVTRPAAGTWVKRSEAATGVGVTMASAASGAKKVVRSAGASRVVVADGPDYDLLPTMASAAAGAGNLIQSGGADRTQSDSSIVAANVVTNATGLATAGDKFILSVNGTDKTVKPSTVGPADVLPLAGGTMSGAIVHEQGTASDDDADDSITLNKQSGIVTTKALTTAAGAYYNFTLVNSRIVGATTPVVCSNAGGTNTKKVIFVQAIPAAGSASIWLANLEAVDAADGTVALSFIVG